MGTKIENSQYIDQFKEKLKKTKWTRRIFSDHYFENVQNLEGTCLDKEADAFYERFRKSLQRKSTSIATIQGYIEYLEKTDDFRKVGGIRTQCVSDDLLSSDLLKDLKDISKCLTQQVRQND